MGVIEFHLHCLSFVKIKKVHHEGKLWAFCLSDTPDIFPDSMTATTFSLS